jgi:hypothetical protein
MRDKDFLQWILDRLVHVHNENPHVDYILKLQAIVDITPEEQYTSFITRGNDDSNTH